jgi:uncharacterized protein YggE
VQIDDVSRVGEIADAVVQSGATSLAGIRFEIRDRSAAEREALRLAVEDARGRADAAAAGAGRSIDRIQKIEDQRTEIFGPRPMAALSRVESSLVTDVAPGLLEIRGRVTLTVSMK